MDIFSCLSDSKNKIGDLLKQYFSTTQDSEQAPCEAMHAFIYHPVNIFLIANGSVISLSGLKLS